MRVFLVIQNLRLARGMSCNGLMEFRQGTESMGATKKVTFLFYHQEKLRIKRKRIWQFSVALELQFMTIMILHQITSLNVNINIKVN